MSLLTKDLVSAIESLGSTTANSDSFVEKAQMAGASVLASVAGAVADAVDEVNGEFILGCCDELPQGFNLDSLTLSQMDELYRAALEINPVEGIIEREKNSPSGQLVRTLVATVFSKADTDDGGSGSSPSSDELTAGAYDPSETPRT